MSITFITPHQRPNSGGVYAIEQFAIGCARWTQVTLVCEKGPTRQVRGVRVLGPMELAHGQLPDAEVIVVPADSASAASLYQLPPKKGAIVLLLQGYGAPGNPVVKQNLENARLVLAGSTWLVEEASAAGCTAELVRYGLNRALFFPGPPADRRAPVVGMMVSQVAWKGTADGLAALRAVQERAPGVQIRLFGAADPCFPGASFLAAPPATRRDIGELMRECAVFVCSSLQEGFGLPGLEAMACGAALVTTDTKGSRDYARDGETALVTPPGEPHALAEAVETLLREPRLRVELCAHAAATASSFPQWPQASDALMVSLQELQRGGGTPRH